MLRLDLSGRVALVTGARHGIGAAIARGLAGAGANVIVTSRTPRPADSDGGFLVLALDVGDPDQVDAVVRRAHDQWGRLDVVVNNAALSVRSPALEHTLADWNAVLRTNLTGPFLVSRAAARVMDAGGSIVNVSSTFGRVAIADRAAYATSKAGLEHLTRLLAVEWAARGIRVNAVAPAATLTETRRAVLGDPAARAERTERIPLGRLGEPDDVVGAVVLLASDEGGFITGETLVVDGGSTLRGPA